MHGCREQHLQRKGLEDTEIRRPAYKEKENTSRPMACHSDTAPAGQAPRGSQSQIEGMNMETGWTVQEAGRYRLSVCGVVCLDHISSAHCEGGCKRPFVK